MKEILRKLFLLDWNPKRLLIHFPDNKKKLYNGRDKLNLRKIKRWKKRHDIENNFYKNFESD